MVAELPAGFRYRYLSDFRFPKYVRQSIEDVLPSDHKPTLIADLELAAAVYLFRTWWLSWLKTHGTTKAQQHDVRHRGRRVAALAAQLEQEIENLPKSSNLITAHLFQERLGGEAALRAAITAVRRLKAAGQSLDPPRPKGAPRDPHRALLQFYVAAVLRNADIRVSKARTGVYARVLEAIYEAVGLGELREPFRILERVNKIHPGADQLFRDDAWDAQEDLERCIKNADIVPI